MTAIEPRLSSKGKRGNKFWKRPFPLPKPTIIEALIDPTSYPTTSEEHDLMLAVHIGQGVKETAVSFTHI